MRTRWLVHLLNITALALVLGLCWWLLFGMEWYDKKMSGEKPVAEHPQLSWSGWVVDWDWNTGQAQALELMDSFDSFQLFLGYFNVEGEVIWQEQQAAYVENMKQQLASANEKQKLNKLKQRSLSLYLTLVNDVVYSDGNSVQKSNALVADILATQQSQIDYIEEFVDLVKRNGLDGLEIDFENIDNSLLEELFKFYAKLHRRFQEEKLQLRIVLEPKMQFEKYDLPEGPLYVVMAYNLYGTHSGPGPKADIFFIGKLAARMENLPGEPAIAIATGGFQWDQANQARSLTEQQIDQLLITHRIEPKRDKDSGAMYFTYTENNERYEVWYADGTTLQVWAKAIQQRGFHKIALWRLGNVTEATIARIK